MAAALGAIREFLHHVTDDWVRRSDVRPVVTILDILEPRVPQA